VMLFLVGLIKKSLKSPKCINKGVAL
jgi:hypothetical protein